MAIRVAVLIFRISFFPQKRNARKEKTLRLHFSPGCSLRQGCDNPQTRFAQTGVATAALPPQTAVPVRNDKAESNNRCLGSLLFSTAIASLVAILLKQKSIFQFFN
ncbi:MAG: hypothetical protein PHV66_06255 [Bacteroidales bacterium]|nr:hypothetical protein [Bacteroidales bacterium]